MVGVLMRDILTRNVLLSRRLRFASLTLLSVVFAMVLAAGIASAQYCTGDQCDECNLCQCSQSCCHELPELWQINTRCAPRCKNLDNGFDCLSYKRYDRKCSRWIRESAETFLAQESSKPTLFYSHGNSLNHKNAMKSCWLIYCKMRCCPGPKRLVFWSWPAERVYKTQGLRVREMIEKNLRIKYVYAEYQGYYLAKLVNQMSLSQRVMMSGHSYGAITAAAALHYIGGGCLRGLTLAGGAPVARPNLRGGIISGAFDNDMLIPGHRYGQAFIAGEKIYVTRNIHDRTLKKWPKTSWTGRRAIGVTGVNANHLGVHRSKLCQQTMYPDVGTSHYLKPHLKSARFVSALCCLAFPDCQNCQLAGATPEVAASPPVEPEESCSVMPDGFDGEQLTAEPEFTVRPVIEHGELDTVLDIRPQTEAHTLWGTRFDLGEIDLADVFGDAGDVSGQAGEAPYAESGAETLGAANDFTSTDRQNTKDYADRIAAAELSLLSEITNISVSASPQGIAVLRPQPMRQHLAPPPMPQLKFSQLALSQLALAQLPTAEYQLTSSWQTDSQRTPPSSPRPQPVPSRPVQKSRVQAISVQDNAVSTSPAVALPPMEAIAGQGGKFWVRGALCLAFVLTSKLYVFFGKRMSPS